MDKAQEKHYKNFERPPMAPCFEPTDDEFRDPIVYIGKLKSVAEKYGVIKIKPPPSFKPPFAIDENKLEFTPRVQKLNELEALSRIKLNFLNKIASFWHLQGTPLRMPLIDNKYLDLYKFHKIVADFGGFEAVGIGKKWQAVTKKISCKSHHSTTLKMHYARLLLPYDKSGLQLVSTSLGENNHSDADESATVNGRRRLPEQNCKAKGGRMMAGVGLKTPTNSEPRKKSPSDDPVGNVLCHSCSGGDDEERLLLCENCDDSYHIYCLLPPLISVPKGDWRCPKCVTEAVCKLDEGFGFEQSQRSYSLMDFRIAADRFKEDYFRAKPNLVSIDDVENEFWKNVIDLDTNISVKYGADLFTEDSYAKHAWNLNNLPVLRNSILSHIKADISGMMIPWLYVGMCFSTFCWHTEDHWTYSINYLHRGARKIWYGVSGANGDKFESAAKEIAPELFNKQPDLLHHIVTLTNPRLLMEKGVDVGLLAGFMIKMHQMPFLNQCFSIFRKFNLLFLPRFGFNAGFNVAEAVNFAPSDWLQMGRQCVDNYSLLRRFCVFSHDELICSMANESDQLDVAMSIAAYKDMLVMIDNEKNARKALKDMGISAAKREIFETLNDDQRQCNLCNTTCYLSALTCFCKPEKMVCLRHTSQLCTFCPPSQFTLKYRYTLDELPPLMTSLLDRTRDFESWIDKVRNILKDREQDDKPDLSELKSLQDSAKLKHFPNCETLEHLSTIIKHADRCSGIAEQLISHRMKTRNRQHGVITYAKKLKLEEVEAFVQQLNKLACRIPQAKAIQDFVHKVRILCSEAQTIFDRVNTENPGQILPDLTRLYEQAVSFDLQIDETNLLKQHLDRFEWLSTVEKVLSMSVIDVKCEEMDDVKPGNAVDLDISLDQLGNLLIEGENLCIDELNNGKEYMEKLRAIQMDMNENEHKACEMLKNANKSTLEVVKRTLDELKSNPIRPGKMVEQLKMAIEKANDWQEKFDKARQHGCSSLFTDQLLSRSRQLSFDFDFQLGALRRDRVKVTDFLDRVHDLFQFQNGPSYHSTADTTALNRLDVHTKTLLEKLRQINADKPSHSMTAEICVCRTIETKRDGDSLVECRLCGEKFHPSCLRWDDCIDENLYLCAHCHRGRRPHINDVIGIMSLLDDVTIPSLEAELIRHLIGITQVWDEQFSTFTSSSDFDPLRLSDADKSRLLQLIITGLALEIRTDSTSKMIQFDLILRPSSLETIHNLGEIRRKRANSNSNFRPLFVSIDESRLKRRSNSPNLPRKCKKIYHDDEQQCSALVCLRPYGDNVNWVQCDSGCEQWFHILCVGLTVQTMAKIDNYCCFQCRDNANSHRLKTEMPSC